SSNENDLVADFFCGSGTTAAVAEKLGRRWIAADLSRYAIHTTRKRMLGIEGCKPFIVQNLGKYERQYWQGVTFNKRKDEQVPLYEYIQFILKLYNAEPLTGLLQIHGKKGKRLVHIGAVDVPVTLSEIKEAIEEVKKLGQDSLDVLGWEWEMGLHDVVENESKESGVKLRLFYIPRDVMDPRAVESGDITFYELAYLETEIEQTKSGLKVKLKDFAIPNLDLIPEEVRSKIKKWSDYIDYWAVDWDWNGDTFHNMWQSYRTKKERKLELQTDSHLYEKKGKHLIMVKVIDIFGNDTTRVLEVKI
ncbi:MAG: site-specific DNA-methyltransferase, partial [Candidatus Omnitrophica bacterium]|nr:site-specific DNA-methyltransferase [Candidatus Omnitrophota bacterium]